MNFIKKVFEGKKDNSTHLQFQKFSKGEFRNRAIIEAKKSKDKYTIKTSAEFANGLVHDVAELLGDKKTSVTGAIVSTSDLTGKIDFKDKKQFQGVKRYLIDKEMSGKEIIALLDEFPKTFFALTFDAGETKLKIKPKAPKSVKPGKGDEAPKADFCNLKTTDKELGGSFIFEKEDFKTAKVNHTLFIENIIVPEELKKEEDFAKIREMSNRAGRIIRNAEIDEVEAKKEFEFEA
jgi:hypothetical protein